MINVKEVYHCYIAYVVDKTLKRPRNTETEGTCQDQNYSICVRFEVLMAVVMNTLSHHGYDAM